MDNTEQILKEYQSPINKYLKIVKKGNKKLLNTKYANYSYGTLVDVLEYGLDSIPLTNVSSVLLLGFGGGSIIESLRKKYDCHAPVVAVDIDPLIIDIARDEFDVKPNKLLEIHCMDAWDYIEKSNSQFDLIIVDIFIDMKVPKKFYKPQFWEMLSKNLTKDGFVLFNAGIDLFKYKVRNFVRKLPDSFVYQKNYNILYSNTVIIMQKIT
ncbi:MAG: fused MFS/spermidine synthase [Bacteroidales bacterium]|nr:fused MFS/spermidine synthase [Bacteroidales bacterium]